MLLHGHGRVKTYVYARHGAVQLSVLVLYAPVVQPEISPLGFVGVAVHLHGVAQTPVGTRTGHGGFKIDLGEKFLPALVSVLVSRRAAVAKR